MMAAGCRYLAIILGAFFVRRIFQADFQEDDKKRAVVFGALVARVSTVAARIAQDRA